MPSGTVRFGFFNSPLTPSDVSNPAKAKNKIREVSVKVFNEGIFCQCRFAAFTRVKPKIIMPSSGNNFSKVISFTKPIACFVPRILINTISPISIKKKSPRIDGSKKTGNNIDKESAMMFITAALPKMPQPKKNKQLIINPGKFPKVFST